MWTNPESVRVNIGLTSDEVSDAEILPHIYKAQTAMLGDLCIYVRDDTLSGNIDGNNTTFETTYGNITDKNFDNYTNTLDVEVYKWGKANSLDLRETVSLNSIDATYGYIYLTTAPANTFEAITATYYAYVKEVDVNQLKVACALLSGYYYVMAEYLLIPPTMSHGAYRFRMPENVKYLKQEYDNVVARMLPIHRKSKSDDITQIRGEVI
jgi:hypothetical protein